MVIMSPTPTVTITEGGQIRVGHAFRQQTFSVADVTAIQEDLAMLGRNTLIRFRQGDGPLVETGWNAAKLDREDFIARILAQNPAVQVRRLTAATKGDGVTQMAASKVERLRGVGGTRRRRRSGRMVARCTQPGCAESGAYPCYTCGKMTFRPHLFEPGVEVAGKVMCESCLPKVWWGRPRRV